MILMVGCVVTRVQNPSSSSLWVRFNYFANDWSFFFGRIYSPWLTNPQGPALPSIPWRSWSRCRGYGSSASKPVIAVFLAYTQALQFGSMWDWYILAFSKHAAVQLMSGTTCPANRKHMNHIETYYNYHRISWQYAFQIFSTCNQHSDSKQQPGIPGIQAPWLNPNGPRSVSPGWWSVLQCLLRRCGWMEKIASFRVKTRYLQWKMMTNDDCKESFFLGGTICSGKTKWHGTIWNGTIVLGQLTGWVDFFFSPSLTFFFSMCLKGLWD